MAYTRGNLAVKPKPAERVSPGYREQTKVVTRRTFIPLKEKMLYLFTVIICVALASLVLQRYAHIYDLNKQSQRMNSQIKANQLEMAQLELKKQTLKETIVETALKEGYVLPSEQSIIHVPRVAGSTDVTDTPETDTDLK